jgi:hypothetical protein
MEEVIDRVKEIRTKAVIQNHSIIDNDQLKVWINKKPGIVALDADGTLLEMKNGDHWFSLINQLPQAAQDRIANRIKLLGKSTDLFEQKYLSASSLYEFALNGWHREDMQKFAYAIKIRPGALELINNMTAKGYKVLIVSYGIMQILTTVFKDKTDQPLEIYANETTVGNTGEIAPIIEDFIPDYDKLPTAEDQPEVFRKFVDSIETIPLTKGLIINMLLDKYDCIGKKNLTVGDSEGDLKMFESITNNGGISILHVHADRPNKDIMNSDSIDKFMHSVHFFSVNREDHSFEPTASLINNLI